LKTVLAKKLPEILLVLFAFALLFFRLGHTSLEDWDEAVFAQVAKEMVESGDWLTLHYGNEPRFEKPPLQTWITALLFLMFEVNEFWARAASAFSAIFLVIITFKISERLYSRQVGFVTMLPLLTGYELLRRSRMGTTDIILTLFIYLGIYAYLRVKDNPESKWWYLFWLSVALGFMVKFWAVAILPISLLITLFLRQAVLSTLRSRAFWQGILVATLVIAPWHILMIITYGQSFVDIYIVRNLIERSGSGLEGNTGGIFFYIMLLPRMFFPWFFLTPIAFLLCVHDHIKHRSRNPILVVLVVIVIGIYSLAVETKIFQYFLPVFPALAIMIGFMITRALQYRSIPIVAGLLLSVVTVAIVALLTGFVPNHMHLALATAALCIALLTTGFLALMRFGNNDQTATTHQGTRTFMTKIKKSTELYLGTRPTWALFHVCLTLFLCSYLVVLGLNRSGQLYTGRFEPIAEIAQIAGYQGDLSSKPILGLAVEGHYDVAVWGPTVMFYSDRPVQVAGSIDDLAMFVHGAEAREIILGKSLINDLHLEFIFDELANVDPYVYGVIRRREPVSEPVLPKYVAKYDILCS
jgi:4-amino-4-deoxy-L-arabinose transferase-like glycosyltransferase